MEGLSELVSRIEPASREWENRARERLGSQIRPRGSLGRLEDMAAKCAAATRSLSPDLSRRIIFTMAGDHGVAEEGVSAYPQEVTPQMVGAFVRGWATINCLARHVGAEVRVVDCGVAADLPADWPIVHEKIGRGTGNIARGPAMSRGEAEKGVLLGARLVVEACEREGFRLFGTGDMGIANTTPSAAIAAAMTGRPPADLAGRGTGIDDAGWRRKVAAVERALAVNAPDPRDPLGVLAKVGGFEIAALAGAVLGAAAVKCPVICDGFIATAGALIACALVPAARDYLFVSHRSEEAGHGAMVEHLGLSPILDLGMRLGEGTGSALAMPILEASVKVLAEVLTFAEAGVTDSGA